MPCVTALPPSSPTGPSAIGRFRVRPFQHRAFGLYPENGTERSPRFRRFLFAGYRGGFKDVVVINASFGLGEMIVQGAALDEIHRFQTNPAERIQQYHRKNSVPRIR